MFNENNRKKNIVTAVISIVLVLGIVGLVFYNKNTSTKATKKAIKIAEAQKAKEDAKKKEKKLEKAQPEVQPAPVVQQPTPTTSTTQEVPKKTETVKTNQTNTTRTTNKPTETNKSKQVTPKKTVTKTTSTQRTRPAPAKKLKKNHYQHHLNPIQKNRKKKKLVKMNLKRH